MPGAGPRLLDLAAFGPLDASEWRDLLQCVRRAESLVRAPDVDRDVCRALDVCLVGSGGQATKFLDLLLSLGVDVPGLFLSRQRLLAEAPSHDDDPQLPRFWLMRSRNSTLRVLVDWLRASPDGELPRLARQTMFHLFSVGLWRDGVTFELDEVASLLRERHASIRQPDLEVACQYCGGVILQSALRQLPDGQHVDGADVWAPVSDRALEWLGKLRLALKDDEQARAELEAAESSLWITMRFLQLWAQTLSGAEGAKHWWGVLRRLLLAFRELPQPATPPDLRTWGSGDEAPLPRPWHLIPQEIAHHLGEPLSAHLQGDAQGLQLRQIVAEFFLKRIQTREGTPKAESAEPPMPSLTNADMLEPDPEWRMGYVRAAAWLQVNPRGKGHRALLWSAHHDPAEEVRQTAGEYAERFRRGAWPKAGSPRAMLFGAFRELRQAQLLSHGVEVDADGARATAREEVRRIKRVEVP